MAFLHLHVFGKSRWPNGEAAALKALFARFARETGLDFASTFLGEQRQFCPVATCILQWRKSLESRRLV
jgi:hypothetical protein